jgi:ABC-type multidrug transport system fused ATPase/permease subunit
MDMTEAMKTICANLHGNSSAREESLLLLRLMEFCGFKESTPAMFQAMAEQFHIPDSVFADYKDYVCGRETEHVMIHPLEGTDGQVKTLFEPTTGVLIFTYTGTDSLLLNDVPVLPGAYQVMLQSSVLKSRNGQPVYYSTIIEAYQQRMGGKVEKVHPVEYCGRDINFRFPGSDNGIHNLSFTLRNGELLAVMGGSGTGKTTLLSLLNGSMKPQEGTLTINGHDI